MFSGILSKLNPSNWAEKEPISSTPINYSSLTAVKNVSTYKNYEDAFEFIRDEHNLRNIALTGSYGAGKSSLLLTFQDKHEDLKFLNLSLATFDLEDGEKTEESEIEKSIFKQMLYGEHSNKLHYSRFRGITTPKATWRKSLLLFFLISGAYFGLKYHANLYEITHKSWSQFWLVVIPLALWSASAIAVIRHLYKISIGLTVKKVAIQGASVEADGKESIFNEHLDEIVYFFQSTSYDFVVIEDLDRFNNTNIFINLRELNSLINENHEIKKKRKGNPIKFIYAIRDDMFKGKDRTKFFDFIIPVIPFVNTSNSYDKLDELLKSLEVRDNIETPFLRDISLHINDFRHLNNTVNEYAIYRKNLNEDLDQTKLFAVILYKNFYPEDFEKLHEGEGELFKVIKNKSSKIQKLHESISSRISEIDDSIAIAKESLPRNIQGLAYLYSGWLMSHLGANVTHIYTPEGNTTPINPISIDHLIAISRNPSKNFSIHRSGYSANSNISPNELAQDLHPNQTILERQLELEQCNRDNITALQDSLHDAMEEMRRINHTSLASLYSRDELRETLGLTSPDLLIYLIAEGFIDENYYSYMSYFHEGAITKTDHQFLLNCQADKDVEPQYVINTPDELCHRLGEIFFEKKQSLNISLFDQLLSKPNKYKSHLNNALNYIQRNFEGSEVFLVAYYASGKDTSQLLQALCHSWKYFGNSVCKSNIAHTHLAHIIVNLGDNTALLQQNSSGAFTTYLNKNSHLVFNQEICRECYDFLETLGVKINDLGKCSKIPEFIDSVIKHSAFSISASNVSLILNHLELPQDQIVSANYTSIQNCSNDTFREHISNHLDDYIENVFIDLPANSEESEEQIIGLLNRDDIVAELKEKVIDVQKIVYLFKSVPEELWVYLLEQEKAVVTWENLAVYYASDNSNETLVESLNTPVAYEALSKQRTGNKNKELVLFVMKNNEITDEAYKRILASESWTIPSLYEGLSEAKWFYLLERDFVKLNANTFSTASEYPRLCAELIKNNFKDYSDAKADYALENDVIEKLLESTLPDESKLTVCYDIDSSRIEEGSVLMPLAAECYADKKFNIEDVDSTLVELAFSNASSDSIAIQILCRMIPTWGEVKVMNLLRELGGEYKKIATYGSWVPMDATDEHQQLASLLVEHKYISSVSEKDGNIRFNTKKSAN